MASGGALANRLRLMCLQSAQLLQQSEVHQAASCTAGRHPTCKRSSSSNSGSDNHKQTDRKPTDSTKLDEEYNEGLGRLAGDAEVLATRAAPLAALSWLVRD